MEDHRIARAALVTGAGRRIGRAVALGLARSGFDVALHCRDSHQAAEETAEAVRALGRRAAVLTAELGDAGAVAALVPEAAAALGSLGVLVNNASLFEADEVGRLDPDLWERHFAVNLRAPVFLAEAFAAQVAKEGVIVNVVDQRVWKLTPRFFSYTLSKAALWTATRTLAQALAPKVRVNAVGPGPTLPSARQTPEDFERQRAALLLRRGPSPDEIADAVGFIIRARAMTGQMIALDGGQHLAWETPDVLDGRE